MSKKYEFTGKEKEFLGRTLKQIVCVTAFASISVGEVGGWIESESNLDHSGNAWVYGNAMVYGDARVYGNAWVYGKAMVYGNARVYGNAMVYGNAWVYGKARVYGNAEVYGDAMVYGNAEVYGNAMVYGNAEVLTKKAITINSNSYHVTITDTHITIGCQNKEKEFWKNADFETIKEIDGEDSAKEFMEFKPFIMKLAEVD